MKDSSSELPTASGGEASTRGKTKGSGVSATTKANTKKKPATVTQNNNVKEKAKKPLKKRQKLRNHCGRFWLWYLILSIVLLAITLPLTFLKIIPAVVQKIIDDMDLPIMDARIGALSPTELAFSFSTIFSIPGGFSVRLDTLGLSLYNTFTPGFYPYTYTQLPDSALHLKGPTKISLNTTATVLNETEISKWINTTVNGVTTTFSFRGSTTLHLGALKMPVNVDKSVDVPALNQLKGFGLNSLQILIPAEPNGTNMVGNMTLPNVSGLDVNLGDLSFNGSVAGIVIANLSVANALLLKGNNTIPFQGQLFLDTIIGNLGTILGNSSTLSGGNFNMVIKDGQSVVGGQHIPWVESVLAHSPLLAAVPLTQLLQSALGTIVGPGTGTPPGGTTKRTVDHLLKEGGVGLEPDSRQARRAPGTNRNTPLRPRAGDNGRTLDVSKAVRLYQELQRRRKT